MLAMPHGTARSLSGKPAGIYGLAKAALAASAPDEVLQGSQRDGSLGGRGSFSCCGGETRL